MSRPLRLSAESRLVFATVREIPDVVEASAMAREVRDWPRVLRLAEREAATAPLHRLLQRSGAPIPDEVAEYLAKSAMVSDFRMRHLARRLGEIVAELARAHVPVLLLKGAAVGAMSDASFRSRPMSDLDLLVRPVHAARARDAVIAAGWPEVDDPVIHELLRGEHHGPPFLDPQMPGLRLELHTALLPHDHSFALDEEAHWRDAHPAAAPFGGAFVPSPEHLLLHACMHFAWQHGMAFGAWRTFRACAVASAAKDFSWERFERMARTSRAASAAHWTLRLAHRLGGTPVPPALLSSLAPPFPLGVDGPLERHFVAMIAEGERPPSPSIKLSRLLWKTALRPRWSGHRAAGRRDPAQRWERALGLVSTEGPVARLVRHLADYRSWWSFLTRTLLR